MCGLAGFWEKRPLSTDEARSLVEDMRDALVSRGPDDAGSWGEGGLWLGHRRLSILDLSPQGRQPMTSASGRYVTAYNGEIYNFRELRRELERSGDAPAWRGDSDTEVLLAGVDAWGLDRAVSRFVGMFAFALWDRSEKRLHLVRDRLGIKPLVYGTAGGALVFGSDLRALRRHPEFDPQRDPEALAAYLRFNCVPAPMTIHRHARKVSPGVILSFSSPSAPPRETSYWSAPERAAAAHAAPFQGDDKQAVDALEAAIGAAVRDRLVADVPLGAFLSGGIDSSTVVALMQQEGSARARTFSIGNRRADYDEGDAAEQVAAHLGTEHTALTVGAPEALAVVERLAEMYDEPFADSSQIPTFLVSQMARQHVTVTLSGDGGDELLGGYNRHVWGPRVHRLASPVPRRLRAALAWALRLPSPGQWDRAFERAGQLAPAVRLPGDKIHKLAGVLAFESDSDLYRELRSHWSRPNELLRVQTDLGAPWRRTGVGFAADMMLWDLTSYLPDDILTKVDRASMAVSLEARVPLLDHRVVETAWSLPSHLKVHDGVGKVALRRVLERHVPRRLWDRPKMGFGVPIDDWLRVELRDWAEELLSERRLRAEGVFVPGPIRAKWREHLSGRKNWAHHLWDILMFQAWSASC